MAIAGTPSISLGISDCHICHTEGFGCSISHAITSSWIKSPFESPRFSDHFGLRHRSAFLGATKLHWLPAGHEICPSKILVAADYSDSVPDSSNYVRNHGYHPLEELKAQKLVRDTKLTPAEIARTTVEGNSSALLVFPYMVHCEPHEHISWAEFQYVIDEYGDIFFEIFDNENILQDRGANNPVNVLIGMDITTYENRKVAATGYNVAEIDTTDDILLNDGYFEVEDTEMSDIPVQWGMPTDAGNGVHPIYFAKCLTKAVNMEHAAKMDHPSNGVSIVGCLRPAFMDEELYLQRIFSGEDSDGYTSEWKDGEVWGLRTDGQGKRSGSTLYRLEIMRIELFSVYGVQASIGLQDFQEAEPDVLVHSTSAIVEHFSEQGIRCNFALKALCKKKGLCVEAANLIGVDSLGMDVRILSGVEVQTHRFPFKVRATSEGAAVKQIHQLLFPRARRKRFRAPGNGLRDLDPF
ncbi:uncharacterized protein At3g49140 isoform X1 [Diospyros lotus]|uniref:uncharacterized protein At3g49140 isoform X1 n=1 Tax=Diospyros lotus TaxID=55363 RepID=UPI002251E1B4|nr:uncharacterized protein At3g49140 isoform X1 [Diospyros lotus]